MINLHQIADDVLRTSMTCETFSAQAHAEKFVGPSIDVLVMNAPSR
jgi:hypothetical protein